MCILSVISLFEFLIKFPPSLTVQERKYKKEKKSFVHILTGQLCHDHNIIFVLLICLAFIFDKAVLYCIMLFSLCI